jgi:hypothetical protein
MIDMSFLIMILTILSARAQTLLKGPDVLSLGQHYSTPPAGLWILRLGQGFLGLVALDADSTSNTAVIRHIYVDEPFRRAAAQDDLISFALGKAFANKHIDTIRFMADPLRPYTVAGAKQAGFKLVDESSERYGLLGWRLQEWQITREQWQSTKSS